MPSCPTLNDFRKPAELPTPAGFVGAPCELTAVGAANEVRLPTAASFMTRFELACVAFDWVVVPGSTHGVPVKPNVSVPLLVSWPLALKVRLPLVTVMAAPPARSDPVAVVVQFPEPAGFGVNVSTMVCCCPKLSNTCTCCCTGLVACEFRFPKTSNAVVLLAALTVCGIVRCCRPRLDCGLIDWSGVMR